MRRWCMVGAVGGLRHSACIKERFHSNVRDVLEILSDANVMSLMIISQV
jgi:hypothetical protein